MNTLESIVLPLADSRALVEHGVVLDTALAWYPEHCDDYEAEAPASLWPDEWKRIAEGCPVVCVREEMEDHEPICSAPVLSELMNAIDFDDPTGAKMIVLSHALIALHDEAKS